MQRSILACHLPQNEKQRRVYVRNCQASRRWRLTTFFLMIFALALPVAAWLFGASPSPINFIGSMLGIMVFAQANKRYRSVNGKTLFELSLEKGRDFYK